MPAVAEAKPDKTAAELLAVETYAMPRPKKGVQLLWYPHANPTEDPEIAFALKVGHRAVLLQTASGVAVDTVRHLSDPKLHLNDDQRANGAWDFPEDSGLSARVAALESQVASILELLDKPVKK
jgi:hypothetical protein